LIDDRTGHPRKGPAKQCRSTEIRELDRVRPEGLAQASRSKEKNGPSKYQIHHQLVADQQAGGGTIIFWLCCRSSVATTYNNPIAIIDKFTRKIGTAYECSVTKVVAFTPFCGGLKETRRTKLIVLLDAARWKFGTVTATTSDSIQLDQSIIFHAIACNRRLFARICHQGLPCLDRLLPAFLHKENMVGFRRLPLTQ
jgi:hypothetical protein